MSKTVDNPNMAYLDSIFQSDIRIGTYTVGPTFRMSSDELRWYCLVHRVQFSTDFRDESSITFPHINPATSDIVISNHELRYILVDSTFY